MIRGGIIFCLLLPLLLSGQPEFNWSNNIEYNSVRREFHYHIAKTTDNKSVIVSGINSTRLSPSVYNLQLFDLKNLQLSEPINLNLPDFRYKETELLQFEVIDNRVVVLYNSFNKKKLKNYLIGIVYDLKGNQKVIPTCLDSLKVNSINRRGEFIVRVNQKQTELLLTKVEPFEKSALQPLIFKIFNGNLKSLKEYNFELPFKSRGFDLSQIELGNDLNTYHLIKVTNEFKKWTTGDPNFKYVLVEVGFETNEIKEYELKLGKKSISDIAYRVDSNLLQVVGLFSSDGNSIEESSGLFYISINTDKREIINTAVSNYPQDMAGWFLSPNKIAKGKEIRNLVIRRMLPKESGATIVLEQYLYREVCNVDARTGIVSCEDNYYYNDLVFVTLNDKGKMDSYNVLKKAQYASVNDESVLSSLVVTDGKADYAFFYDNPKNDKLISREKVKVYEAKMKWMLMLAKVQRQQPIVLSEYLVKLDKKQRINHQEYFKVNDSTYLIYAESKRNYRFGVLKVK